MEKVVIVSAVRTAIGSFGGALADIPATDLGAVVVKAALQRANLSGHQIDEAIIGNVLQAGLGQNPARQVILNAGLPIEVPATTINILCGSGLHAVTLAYQSIRSGAAQTVITGGIENMSRAPFATDAKSRWGYKMGDQTLSDLILKDGLTCAVHHYHMGITAENIAEKYAISREEQDAIALSSQTKAVAALANGVFEKEIVPVSIIVKKQQVEFKVDQYPRATDAATLAKLRPAFAPNGTITAGNASGINDAAAAVIVMAESQAKALNLPILAYVRATATAGVAPELMGLGPVPATQKALRLAGLSIDDIDLIEANEAFAAQFIAVGRDLNFDLDKVYVNGGAIALGHPIGASGSRILVTLLHALQARNKTLGLATLCIGGGMGSAVIIERV